MQNQHIPPCAKETRALARETLKGQWPIAILVNFLAGILGGSGSSTPEFNVDLSGLDFNVDLPTPPSENIDTIVNPDFVDQLSTTLQSLWPILIPFVISILAVSLVFLVIGPCIHWGLCRFRLGLVDGEQPSVGTLFSGFSHMFLKALGLSLVQFVIIFLISLAVFIPAMVVGIVSAIFEATVVLIPLVLVIAIAGSAAMIIVAYRFSMSFYILADNPDMDIMDTLRGSARMMKGNKWRLFCLQISFIGWSLLCVLTGGLGAIVLAPYTGQAVAVFYHHVSGRAAVREAVEELAEFSEGL